MQMSARQGSRMAKIGPVEFPATLAIGSPVPLPALMARSFFARSEGPERAAKGEARGALQPGIPGGCSHLHPIVSSIAQIEQGLTLYDGNDVVIVAHAHFQTFQQQRFQNSIAHVLEPSLIKAGRLTSSEPLKVFAKKLVRVGQSACLYISSVGLLGRVRPYWRKRTVNMQDWYGTFSINDSSYSLAAPIRLPLWPREVG